MPELSIVQQALGLRAVFATARSRIGAKRLEWTGVLRPTSMSRDYTVTLSYHLGRRPQVQVVDPALRCDADGDIPHLYRDGTICLYDSRQWTPAMLFVDTLIPWTSEWLYFYELWLATSTWYGDGDAAVDLGAVDLPAEDRPRRQNAARHGVDLMRHRP